MAEANHSTHDPHDAHDHGPPMPLRRLWALIRPEARDLRMVVVFGMFIAILSLVIPIAIQSLVETVQFGVVLWPILVLSLVMAGCLLFAAGIRMCESYVVEFLQQRIFVRVLSDFAHRLPRIRLDNIEGRYGPEIVNRFFDVITIQKAGAALLLDGIEIVLATMVGMIVLAFYHPLLLAFDIGLIFMILILFVLGRGAVRTALAESHYKYRAAAWMQEVMRVPRALRTGMGPQFVLDQANEIAEGYLKERRRHFAIVFRQITFALIIQVAASTLLLGLGGLLVVQGSLTWGQLVAAELIVALTLSSLTKIGKYFENYYDLLTAVEKLGMVTDLQLERRDGDVLNATSQGMGVKILIQDHDVGHARFSPMDWEIRPGERVALVGASGTGKSVLLDILAGFREPTVGHIELDGIDLRDLNLDSVRQQVAIVRGVELFSGTIMDNIRVGRDYLTLQEIRDSLEIVGMQEFIQTLPEGMGTLIAPTGSPLSRGQALRLSIARAIVGRPRLLILDGVLDELDVELYPKLFQSLFDRSIDWTLLIASRSNDVVDRCDRTVELHSASGAISSRYRNI